MWTVFDRRLLVRSNWIWSDNTCIWIVSARIALVRWEFQFARTKSIRSHIFWSHKLIFITDRIRLVRWASVWSDTCCLIRYCSSEQKSCPIRVVLYAGCQIFVPSDEIHQIRLCHVSCTVHLPQHYITPSYPTVAFFRNFLNHAYSLRFAPLQQSDFLYLCVFWFVIKVSRIEGSSLRIKLPSDHYDLNINPKSGYTAIFY